MVGASVSEPSPSHASASDWPPSSWWNGHSEDLTLAEAAVIVSRLHPDDPAAQDLALQLERLATMPAEYEATARIVLQALAQAMWHESQALAGLSPRERDLVLSSDPRAPPSPELQKALAGVDDGQVAQAAAVLLSASQQVQGLLRDPLRYAPRSGGGALALARQLDYTGPIHPVPDLGPVSADALARRLAVATGAPADSLLEQAEAIPPEARAQLARVLFALEPFRAGAPVEPAARLVTLAATLDEAAPVLRGWAAASLAEALYGRTGVDLQPPRPDAPISLRWGLPDTGERPLPPARSMGDAAATLADLILPGSANAARRQIEALEPRLTSEQADAISRAWDAATAYVGAAQGAQRAQLPDGVDPADLVSWSRSLAAGEALPEGTLDSLEESLPFLEALWEQQAAQEDLLAAVEGILPPFHSTQAASPVCAEANEYLFLLALDSCGTDTEWQRDVLLSIDVGGDDTYRQRAGAPFLYDPYSELPDPDPVMYPAVGVPFNFLVDLAGSDTYVTTRDCAQAAACTGHPEGDNDRTGLSDYAPISVLVDLNGADQPSTNHFQAANRSQAFAGPLMTIAPTPLVGSTVRTHAPLAVLVEAVASSGTLTSTYEAKDRSQASATNDHIPATRYYGGHAVLERLSGNASRSQATFTAGDLSQGVADFGGLHPFTGRYSLAAFLNLAGSDATAHDDYTAGTIAQGALDDAIRRAPPPPGDETSANVGFADALFIDAVGPGAASDDTYHAVNKARGYLNNFGHTAPRAIRALFIDAALAVQSSDPTKSVRVSATEGVEVAPFLDDQQRSNDTYLGPITPGRGYGWSMMAAISHTILQQPTYLSSGFFDVSGDDAYVLSSAWEDVAFIDRPANDNQWPHHPLANVGSESPLHGGVDLSLHDSDRDGWPAALEGLWTAWESDPDSDANAVVADRVFLGTAAADRAFDGAYALVLTAGGSNTYLPGFSAGIQLDLAGDDAYLGRPGAASGAFGEDGDDPALVGPPLAQHPLAFTWDLAGNDTYNAAMPRSQGFGQAGGVGILVDQAGSDRYHAAAYSQGAARAMSAGVGARTPASLGLLLDVSMATEKNLFRASPATSQGWGDSQTAFGLLVAVGGHNTFQDGVNEDVTRGSGGASANVGSSNQAPTVDANGIAAIPQAPPGTPLAAPGPLQIGVPYLFSVPVGDPEGDDLTACWTFEYGTPGSDEPLTTTQCTFVPAQAGPRFATSRFQWNETFQVHSDGRSQNVTRRMAAPYNVMVEVSDPGGQATAAARTFSIRNPPLAIAGDVLGADTVVQGRAAAYQVPLAEPVPSGVTTHVEWGDGTPATTSTSINWALARWGAAAHAAERAPVPGKVDTWARVLSRSDAPPTLLIDGNSLTKAEFTTGESTPLVHVTVDLPGPRRITEINLAGSSDSVFLVSVEGILPDGSLRPIAEVELDSSFAKTIPVPGAPVLSSIAVRQVLPIASAGSRLSTANLHLAEVEAWGPGAAHQWRTSGSFQPNFTVLSPTGARNGTLLSVEVDPLPAALQTLTDKGPGGLEGLPLALAGVQGYGPVRHATVTVLDGATIHLRGLETPVGTCAATNACLNIDWGDGTEGQGENLPQANQVRSFSHIWAAPGDYLVKATVNGRTADVFWAHVEEAFDLTPSGQPPLLYLALDRSDERTSWRLAPVHRAIVDAAGDDRYLGPWAAPARTDVHPLLRALPHPPGLVIDLAGDDDYLSWELGAQGFGGLASAGLLLDAGGDDLYVAPGQAQGAALGHGAGILLDLGGDDVFNPVSPMGRDRTGELVPNADLVDANATLWFPWPAGRPLSVDGPRAALAPPSARVVQGAAEEGLGLLLVRGGFDRFTADAQAQGHASHAEGTSSLLDYATPGGDECMPKIGPVAGLNPPSFIQETVNCFLGFKDWTAIQDQFGSPGSGIVCPGGIAQAGFPCLPNFDRTQEFATAGPRYGSPTGLLIELDGAASHYARTAAQGHAGVGGHGILADMDGAALFAATTEGQASTEGGQAVLLAAGPNGAWLADTGQAWASTSPRNPDSLPGTADRQAPPQAHFLAASADHACAGAECGDARALPDVAPRLVGLAWAADSQVGAASSVVDGSKLKVAFTATSDLQDDVDLVALAQPSASGGADGCTGTAIAPPTVLLRDATAAQGKQTVEFSLDGRLADGPVLPAGCHRVRVFARPAGVPGAAWSVLAGDVRVLRSPLPQVVGERAGPDGMASLVTTGERVALQLNLQEPLMAAVQPALQLQLQAAGSQPQAWPATFGAWNLRPNGSWETTVSFDPPTVGGSYGVHALSSWPGASAVLRPLANLVVSTQTPVVHADPLPSAWWKAGPAIPLVGTVDDHGHGLQRLALRLVDGSAACATAGPGCVLRVYTPRLLLPTGCTEANCALEAVPAFPSQQKATILCPVGLCALQPDLTPVPTGLEVQALLRPDAKVAGKSHWSVLLQPDDGFTGGPLRVQARLTDGRGATGPWINLALSVPQGAFGLDAGAPRLLNLTTGDGASDTNDDFPIPFVARLRDCAAAATLSCPPGSGIDPASLSLLIRSPSQVVVLKPAATTAQEGDLVATFLWTGVNAPAPGTYRVMVQATDHVGNLLTSNPGVPVRVDFEEPSMNALTFALPAGQTAIKPGDSVRVSLHAEDHPEAPSGIASVTVAVGGTLTALQPNGTTLWAGTVQVPSGMLGGQPQGTPIPFTVVVRDAAGNLVQTIRSFPYFTPPPAALNPLLLLRDTNVEMRWTSDRPVEVQAHVWQADKPAQKVAGEVAATGLDYRVSFTGLAPAKDHDVAIVVRDNASSERTLPFLPFTTFSRVNSTVVLAAPQHVASRVVQMSATLKDPVAGTLRLFAAPGATTPVLELPINVAQQVGDRVVSLEINTTAVYPASLQGAVNVHPWVQYEAGKTLLSASVTLRIDNRAPVLGIHAIGASPRNEWYNRSLEIASGAIDDTGPVNSTGSVDGSPFKAMPVRLEQEGQFVVTVIARDSAVSPNQAIGSATFRIDRTSPTLQANLTRQATGEPVVGLIASATDPGEMASGIEAFRVRVDDDPPSPWLPQAPTEVTLPNEDGSHWVSVQVIDQAGNIRSSSSSVLLDTLPPEVLRVQWFGRGSNDEPMLQFVARDRIRDAPRPAGIDAFRLMQGGREVTPWANTTGVGTATVPEGTSPEGLAIQFRDLASNLADPAPVPPWSRDAADADQNAQATALPGPWLAQSPAVSPTIGDSATAFTFTVVARPLAGKAPDSAEVRIAGEAHPMDPQGTPAKDGSRLYAAELRLPPTDVANPHRFQIRLLYGGQEILSQDAAGPTVLQLGNAPQGADTKASPATPVLWALAALAVAAAARRRRDSP